MSLINNSKKSNNGLTARDYRQSLSNKQLIYDMYLMKEGASNGRNLQGKIKTLEKYVREERG